jgi:hypothetical protein
MSGNDPQREQIPGPPRRRWLHMALPLGVTVLAAATIGMLASPGTASTQRSSSTDAFNSLTYEAQENHGDGAATLDAQLNAGIRAIDIRVRIVNNGTAFAVHHTDVYQNANFDDVLTHARGFLTAHPTETILMDLHGNATRTPSKAAAEGRRSVTAPARTSTASPTRTRTAPR